MSYERLENVFNLITLNSHLDDQNTSSDFIYDINFRGEQENTCVSKDQRYAHDDRECTEMPVQLSFEEMLELTKDLQAADLFGELSCSCSRPP